MQLFIQLEDEYSPTFALVVWSTVVTKIFHIYFILYGILLTVGKKAAY